jgi:phosphopantetheinyl transferase
MMDTTEMFHGLESELNRITLNLTSDLKPADETRMVLTDSMAIHGTRISLEDSESVRDLVTSWLCDEEVSSMQKYRRKPRATLYLIGRIILKRCIIDYSMQRGAKLDAKQIMVVDNENGRPEASGRSNALNSAVYVSLSHKHDIFIGSCSGSLIGIDIESLAKAHPGLSHRILASMDSDKDLVHHVQGIIGASRSAAIQNTLWCVREAAFKSFSPGFVRSPLNVQILLVNNQIVPQVGEGKHKVRRSVYIAQQNEYVCCIAY